MTIGGWIFFILAGGAITFIMVCSYIKVFKDSMENKSEDRINQ